MKPLFTALTLTFAALPLSAQDAAEPPVEAERKYATTPVVIETTLGPITVALESERAPISTANFLRYVDEDRFDGTVFYRAMTLDWEQPNGLIQAGTQYDPKRILPRSYMNRPAKPGCSTSRALSPWPATSRALPRVTGQSCCAISRFWTPTPPVTIRNDAQAMPHSAM